jgi:hypothetical protein
LTEFPKGKCSLAEAQATRRLATKKQTRQTPRYFRAPIEDNGTMFSIYRSEESLSPLRMAWEMGDAALREAIMRATLHVDEQLGQDPQEQGESREGGARIVFQAPVAVLFEVDADKKLVTVLRSWAYCPVRDKDGLCG